MHVTNIFHLNIIEVTFDKPIIKVKQINVDYFAYTFAC